MQSAETVLGVLEITGELPAVKVAWVVREEGVGKGPRPGAGTSPASYLTPLTAGCDNTGELLAIIARKGNAGSNTAEDHLAIIDAAIAAIPARWRRNLLVTIDGAGSSHAVIEHLTALNDRPGWSVAYSVGFDLDLRARTAIGHTPEDVWSPALRSTRCAATDATTPSRHCGRCSDSHEKHGLVFSNPTVGLKASSADPGLIPMTDAEIRAVELLAVRPAERLIIALAAEHAARTDTIRHLTLDDVDLPNRRITLAGHNQRLGQLTHRALRSSLDHRRATWPTTPNRHVIVSAKTALGTGPVGKPFIRFSLAATGSLSTASAPDRILHEALTAGPDPLHLSLVFHLSHHTASRYAAGAQQLLGDELEQPVEP